MMRKYNRSFTTDELQRFSDIDQLVISCKINGIEGCEFEFYFDFHYLNCYRLKADSVSSESSIRFKLEMSLFAGTPLEGISTNTESRLGFNLFVENEHDFPLLSQPLQLTPSIGRVVTLLRTDYHQSPWPYSSCSVLLNDGSRLSTHLSDRSLFDRTLQTNRAYSRHTCLAVCEQVMTRAKCNCSGPFSYQVQPADMLPLCLWGSACQVNMMLWLCLRLP